MVWAARNGNGQLTFFGDGLPARGAEGVWIPKEVYGECWDWEVSNYGTDPLPDLMWKDEPVEVEIIIRPVEKKTDQRDVSTQIWREWWGALPDGEKS